MSLDLLDKFQGSLIGVAIGDTLGRPFEAKLRTKIHSYFTDFDEFIQENRNIFNTYTDDTQLTIHTAKALIQGNGYRTDNFMKPCHIHNMVDSKAIAEAS